MSELENGFITEYGMKAIKKWSNVVAESNEAQQYIDEIAKKVFYYALSRNYNTERYDEDDDGNEITPDVLIDALKQVGCNELIVEKIKENFMLYANQITEVKSKFNCMKFGTELEYGGRGDTYDCGIVETIKDDGSVSGDGREYNLVPQEMFALSKGSNFHDELEAFMKTNANKMHCTEHPSAGEHIHYSYEEIQPHDGALIENAINDIMNTTSGIYDFKNPITSYRNFEMRVKRVDGIEPYISKLYSMNENSRLEKLYEAFQLLYSTSNRSGGENYGLGRNVTRGYTRHGTIEIRCWRTTLDYRSVLCRVRVGWNWLKWMIEKLTLHERGYIDWELESIISILKDNWTMRDFQYLAFHTNNRHMVGWKEDEIIERLNLTKGYARAIKKRSDLYKKQLIIGSDEEKVRKMFNAI